MPVCVFIKRAQKCPFLSLLCVEEGVAEFGFVVRPEADVDVAGAAVYVERAGEFVPAAVAVVVQAHLVQFVC